MGFYLYRPFGTQLFWGVGNWLFGLNPFGYHVIYYLFFAANTILVWVLCRTLKLSDRTAMITTVLYAFSAAGFNRLYFLSTFQETAMATFVLSTMILFHKKNPFSLATFILALTCKEIAIMTPAILFVQEWLLGNKKVLRLIPFTFVAGGYFLAHKFLYGFFSPEEYPDIKYVFNLRSVLNNYFWYFLWTLGVPEQFVNVYFFRLPTVINPQLFTNFGSFGAGIMFLAFGLAGLVLGAIICARKHLFEDIKLVLYSLTVFGLFLLPVVFFPFHKFASSLSLPTVGFVLILGFLLSKVNFKVCLLVTGVYLLLSWMTLVYNRQTHWNVTRATLTAKIVSYFQKNYPSGVKSYENVYFVGGLSREAWLGLSGPYAFQLLYNDPNIKVYFEETDQRKNLTANSLVINSQMFK